MSTNLSATIHERIRTLIADELAVEESEVTLNADLEIDLGADSLDRAEISFAIEDEFDIEISNEEAEELTTVQKIVDLVAEKTK